MNSEDQEDKNKTSEDSKDTKKPQTTEKLFRSRTNFENWKQQQRIEGKVFTIDWNYPDVAESLKSRGWYQNPNPESINYDLKYSRKARVPKTIYEWQVLNHFPKNYELSAKWNLCETIKKNENITKTSSLTYFPICFQMEKEGLNDFCDFFKLLHCLSLLKKFVQNPETKNITKIKICESVCKKWKFKLKSENTKNKVLISDQEWEEIIGLSLENVNESMLSSIVSDVIKTLKSLKKHFPQYDLCGYRDIWIIKPGRKSRGRDIKILNNLFEIKEYTYTPNYWVAQKYIENPLLINSRKFDIRQWVLISSCEPLTIWIYKKCYLRFTAAEFSFEDLSNDFMHLTNNSISKNASNFSFFETNGCMWHLAEFQQFLNSLTKRDYWQEQLYPEIKKIVTSSILTVGKLGRQNSFELLGFDLMVDENLKPWLIEINTSPAMDYSTVIYN